MSSTCDLTVGWNECPNCDLLKERIEVADAATRAAEVRVDCAWNEYLEARNNGLAYFCSPQYRAYHARIDNLEQALAEAHAAQTADIEAWAASIHEHHRLYEDRQQEAEDSSKDVAVDTEEMVTISKAEAVDELVNVYGGHIDKWLEALRERGSTHTDANDNNAEKIETTSTDLDEPFEKEDKLAPELFGKLWYGDVPELELPTSYSTLGPMTLSHCARAIGLYKRMLKRYVPDLADNRPAWVAHRLMDAFDDAAEASEDALSSPTPQERVEYYTERDQCGPDAGEREQARETARRVIADYMGVPADDVHIICSGVVGVGAE